MATMSVAAVRLTPTIPTWECYHCGLLNYDNHSYCKACREKCMYTGEEQESCMESENNENNASKKQHTTLDIITLLAKNSIVYESKCTIMVNKLPEDMVNEDLGSKQLFGMFGDVKKIEIIRNETLIKTLNHIHNEQNPNAEITFYSSESVGELMKLASAYYNYKIFC